MATSDPIQEMFSAIAPGYDLLNRVLSFSQDRSWRRRAAQEACLPPGGVALDVCTGTADLAIELARQYPHASRILGADFSLPMLRLGVHKLTRARLSPFISLQAASAEKLPYRDNSFDGVTVAFGIRNVSDRKQALAEMVRVVRPGGRVILLEFTDPPGRLFGLLYRFYFHQILPRVGRVLSGHRSAYAYLPASVSAFPPPEILTALLQDAGLHDVRYTLLSLGIVAVHVGVK